jgi:hypothetical protein
VSGAGREIWSPECVKSRLRASAIFFPGYNTPNSLEWGREEKEGVEQSSEREEKLRDGAGEEGMGMEGTGGPLSQILDTPLTVQRTPDRSCSTA